MTTKTKMTKPQITKPQMTQTELHRLKNNWAYAQKTWVQQRTIHGLDRWVLVLSSIESKAGVCDYMEQTITISSIFMRGHNCNYAKVRKVLMHEIAHAVTPGHGHGAGWKKKCRQLGGDSRLAITMVLPGMRWAMTCGCCRWRQEYPTKPNVKGMVCGTCRSPLKVKHIK